MTTIIKRQISSLKENIDKPIFDQVCAARWLRDEMTYLINNKTEKAQLETTELLRYIRKIALTIDNNRISTEICNYLFHYVIYLLEHILKQYDKSDSI